MGRSKQILPRIEAQLKPFAPRPHWAKLFTMPPAQLQSQYARLADFKQASSNTIPTENSATILSTQTCSPPDARQNTPHREAQESPKGLP